MDKNEHIYSKIQVVVSTAEIMQVFFSEKNMMLFSVSGLKTLC